MTTTALITFLGPIAAALVPYLLNHTTPLMERVLKHFHSTVTGAIGTGTLLSIFLTDFPCIRDAGNWQRLAIAAIPLIFGALAAPKPAPLQGSHS